MRFWVLILVGLLIVGSEAQSSDDGVGNAGEFVSKLNADFASQPGLRSVHAETSDGALHLKGNVPLFEDERQAIKKASRGSLLVVSHIVVQTTSIADRSLRAQLENRLNEQNLHSLRVRVKHGVVIVKGQIADPAQHELAHDQQNSGGKGCGRSDKRNEMSQERSSCLQSILAALGQLGRQFREQEDCGFGFCAHPNLGWP